MVSLLPLFQGVVTFLGEIVLEYDHYIYGSTFCQQVGLRKRLAILDLIYKNIKQMLSKLKSYVS